MVVNFRKKNKAGGERGVILNNIVPGPLFVGVTGAET